MHTYFLRACAAVAVTLAVGCAAAPSGTDGTTASEEEALRTLALSEIVGDLHYGQTSGAVAYTETPLYRAFRFQGHAGDDIDAWVRSGDGDARAWLLDGGFRNVVSNNNADASTRDAHLVTKLRTSGRFYIAFREVTREDASFTVSLNSSAPPPPCDPEEEDCDSPPPPPPPPPSCEPNCGNGRIVQGADRSFQLGVNKSGEILETWGKGLWEGYVSFTLQVTREPQLDRVVATDATGATYPSGAQGTATRFERLPLPVTLRGSSDSSIESMALVTGITYEVTRVNPIAGSSLRGQFDGVTFKQVTELGSDIPGVTLHVSSSATFFRNFTNGNACARLVLNDKELTAASPTGTFSFVAPLRISSSATCVSARLASPQDSAADFALALSSIVVGDPR